MVHTRRILYHVIIDMDNVVIVFFLPTHSIVNSSIIHLLSNPSEMKELHLMAVGYRGKCFDFAE